MIVSPRQERLFLICRYLLTFHPATANRRIGTRNCYRAPIQRDLPVFFFFLSKIRCPRNKIFMQEVWQLVSSDTKRQAASLPLSWCVMTRRRIALTRWLPHALFMSSVPLAADVPQSFPRGRLRWECGGVCGTLNIHPCVTGCCTFWSTRFVLGAL